MLKCTLPDAEESKQIRRTVDQHGIGSQSRESLPEGEIAAVTSETVCLKPIISTSTLNVVKRASLALNFCAQRIASPSLLTPLNRSLPSEPWFARVDQQRPEGAKEPRNTRLLSYAYAYITSSEIDSGRGPRALNGGAESARQR